MPPRAKYQVKPSQVVGFQHSRRTKHIHLVIGQPEAFVTPCGRPVDVRVPLDGIARLAWTQVCPTCLDGAPGFLGWWQANHQPIPY